MTTSNPIYSLLTQHVASISHHRSRVEVKPEIRNILTKLVTSEEQAFICLLTLFYSRYYKDLNDQPKSYEEAALVVNIKAIAYINDSLSSPVIGEIVQLMSMEEVAEHSAQRCYLDRFAFLIRTLVLHNNA
jgi:hypothetical protein